LVLPTTWLSALFFLVLSFICLGSWANTFKASGSRWRFELFSIDFAVGALIFSLLAAYTLGTLGADLGFSDRMLVAGRTNQALGIAAGALFALGNMLLLAAV
jgi:glucose uptake protein